MNLPNRITILRILLIPVFVIALAYYQVGKDWLRFFALGIFSLAVFTDALDGFFARTMGKRTKLGACLDPLADKLLLDVSFILLVTTESLPRQLPFWLPVVVISRDVILLLGSVLIFIVVGDLKVQPSVLGKVTTVFQMGTVIFTLLNIPFGLLLTIWILTLGLTIVSFFDYILKGSHLLNENKVQTL
ncbi:MAG: CDP-diacylglycerol--glycerol-3-phosphate 3-phosphatidyltransferase [Nitrospirae bacterium]|nr:CDP-diacylglycerol--glycerol-3-phosphate 3-phosphatidyltransferase [Nitrospirota bacterium]